MRVTTLVIAKLIGLQGLWVRGFHFQADKARVVVDVVPRRRKPLCGICGRKVRKNKDRYNRYWRHLDLFGVRTYLRYSIRRVVCRRCGVVREKVPWADKGSRFTKSFEQEVAWLAQRTDVSAVANYFRVTWRFPQVRRIIQRVVAEQRDERRELESFFSEREKSVPAMRVITLDQAIGLARPVGPRFPLPGGQSQSGGGCSTTEEEASCGICGRKVRKNKDRYNRYWRHLDLFGVRDLSSLLDPTSGMSAVWSGQRKGALGRQGKPLYQKLRTRGSVAGTEDGRQRRSELFPSDVAFGATDHPASGCRAAG